MLQLPSRCRFVIVDEVFSVAYFCPNYNSIMNPEFKAQITDNLASELKLGKVSLSKQKLRCVHALGAIRKSNGKLRPITDCKRPCGASINNYMDTMCQEFTSINLDKVSDYMSEGCWFAVLDLHAHSPPGLNLPWIHVGLGWSREIFSGQSSMLWA